MGNEAYWNTFTRTGKVSDYLAYVGDNQQTEGDTSWSKSREEERGQREGTSNGNGAFGSYHW